MIFIALSFVERDYMNSFTVDLKILIFFYPVLPLFNAFSVEAGVIYSLFMKVLPHSRSGNQSFLYIQSG